MSERVDERRDQNGDLVIDNVVSTQPELGPIIPDGGYGWIAFIISLFFQLMVPSLLVFFGVLLAFSRLKTDRVEYSDPYLWDHNMLHVPLFFVASWTLFDPTSRKLILQSTWPKLFATAGTCLICAGILFLWMGLTGSNDTYIFVISGMVAGLGASIQMAQCEILLAQYFRLKLAAITHVSHAVSAIGFILVPVVIGHHIMAQSQTQVILWYQAIILQGLILNIFLRKPMYLKSRNASRYNYVTAVPDEEEDIFSKNSRELQIRVQNPEGSQIQTHELPSVSTQESPPQSTVQEGVTGDKKPKNWVPFGEEEEEDDDEETTKYERVRQWETFDEDEIGKARREIKSDEPKNWETFEDDAESSSKENSRNNRNLQLEMSFGGAPERPATHAITGIPIPLFSDTPVNHNNTYAYDILDDPPDSVNSSVFAPAPPTIPSTWSRGVLDLLRRPTFYKSLLTVMTTKWSVFVFFALFPSYLFQEITDIQFRHAANLIGFLSVTTLIFAAVAYWINFGKRWRAKSIWFLSWFGSLGYYMISDYHTKLVLIIGASMILSSIAALQYVGTPLLGLTVKGEATNEYSLICGLTGTSFLFFVLLNVSFKLVFRLIALLNFLTGCLWLANYIYKRLR